MPPKKIRKASSSVNATVMRQSRPSSAARKQTSKQPSLRASSHTATTEVSSIPARTFDDNASEMQAPQSLSSEAQKLSGADVMMRIPAVESLRCLKDVDDRKKARSPGRPQGPVTVPEADNDMLTAGPQTSSTASLSGDTKGEHEDLTALQTKLRVLENQLAQETLEKKGAIEEARKHRELAKKDALEKARLNSKQEQAETMEKGREPGRTESRKQSDAVYARERKYADSLEMEVVARPSLDCIPETSPVLAMVDTKPVWQRQDGVFHTAGRGDPHRQQLEERGVVFESDSESDSLPEVPPLKSKPPYRDPLRQRPTDSWDLFDVAPQYHSDQWFFDADAKRAEIKTRSRRKATFGKALTASRHDRGEKVHHEIERETSPMLIKVPITCNVEEALDTDSEKTIRDAPVMSVESLKEISIKDYFGLPDDPIPLLASDGQLAYRDGTRNAFGKLSRAKQVFKVGRSMGQLE